MAQATSRIPEKYGKLEQAEAAGLFVPKSLLLDFEEAPAITQGAINSFVSNHINCRFIVRSAHLFEDGGDFSLAGHFWSSGPVIAEQLSETIQQAWLENVSVLESLALAESSARLLTEVAIPPKLVLQEYIEHEIGGVLFSPWSFFPDYVYIEYSETGVKQVVEGDPSVSSVLCLEGHYPDPLPLPEEHKLLRQQLVELCCQLRKVYDFPIDCEWAYEREKQRVMVLQIRPQTHSVGPILPYSAGAQDSDRFCINDNWQFTALSESLGRLSPLSFSLLQQLYTDSIPLFKQLGCKAKCADFMQLSPDGTVLVDTSREAQFYSMTLFGGFQRGLQQTKLASEASAILEQYDSSQPFSYETLQRLFAYWMSANLLSAGAGRIGTESEKFVVPAHAYELSWSAVLEPPILVINTESSTNVKSEINPTLVKVTSKSASFEVLNSWGRAVFLFELNKLKIELKQSGLELDQGCNNSTEPPKHFSVATSMRPYLYFSSWREVKISRSNADLSEENRCGLMDASAYEAARARQHTLAPLALNDYALASATSGGELQALSSTKSVEGSLQIMNNSASFPAQIPADCILVAPYFDNRWISKLKSMKGVVVAKGSRLSHSAIVAREYDVPYYVVPALDLKKLDQGQLIALDPNTVTTLFT